MPLPRSLGSEEMADLIQVALGKQAADLVIRNARLVNVYSGEILSGHAVSISGTRIAYVGDAPDHTIGERTQVLDAGGQTLIPGFIDGHAHLAKAYHITEFLKYAMAGGTTTIITETMEPCPIMGVDGILAFLDSVQDQPVKIFGTAPAMLSISRAVSGISQKTLAQLLDRPDILGLGESYWQGVFQDSNSLLARFEQTLAAGKVLEGHSAGASGKKLSAYLAAGISSCHEAIDDRQALERLRQGLHVMIREGSIRRDLAAISEIRKTGMDTRRLVLVSDGLEPEDLMEKGYMEYLVQKAIDCGFEPVQAIQMASLNVAEHFRIDHLVGGIAPGRYADMVLIPDPRNITAEYVISNGRIIAQNGSVLIPPREHGYTGPCRESIRLPRDLTADDFRVPASGSEASIRIIEMVTELVTREAIISHPVETGYLRAAPASDLLKVSAIDRSAEPGRQFTGFIRGFGLSEGAIASSGAWDTSDIIVVGASDEDMAAAVTHIRNIQGGAVVCSRGRILAEIPLPVMGLISEAPLAELAQQITAFGEAARSLGTPFANPLLTLETLTCAAIPYIRICELGLVNLKTGQVSGLMAAPG